MTAPGLWPFHVTEEQFRVSTEHGEIGNYTVSHINTVVAVTQKTLDEAYDAIQSVVSLRMQAKLKDLGYKEFTIISGANPGELYAVAPGPGPVYDLLKPLGGATQLEIRPCEPSVSE